MIDLKKERLKKGMTQAQLGQEVGVVRQMISNIENGVCRPSVQTAQAISRILGLDWTKFFTA